MAIEMPLGMTMGGRPEGVEIPDHVRAEVEYGWATEEVGDEIATLLEALRAGTLDAQSVLEMCQRRVGNLDHDILEVMTQLEDSNRRSAELGRELTELRNLQEWLSTHASRAGDGWTDDPLVGDEYELTTENVRAWLTASGVDPDTVDIAATLEAWGVPHATAVECATGERHFATGPARHDLSALLGADAVPGYEAALRSGDRNVLRDALVEHGMSAADADAFVAGLAPEPAPHASVRQYMNLNGHDDIVTAADLDARIASLNEELSKTNSGNEMAMIRLQTLMQQRTSLLSMCSNMLKSFDDAARTCVGNLR